MRPVAVKPIGTKAAESDKFRRLKRDVKPSITVSRAVAAFMFDLSQVLETIQRLGNGFLTMLPRLVLAVLVAWAFVFVGRMARKLVERGSAERREHRTLQLALGRLVQAAIVVIGILVAATAAFPTFTMGNLVGTLGVGGVAIGFAFKDIFQNFLAGILLLLTKPFNVGDQIIFKDFEGTVEDIQTRATLLQTYDGRRVVIPNSDLYMNAVTVNTAFPTRRVEHDFGISIDADIERAKTIVRRVMTGVAGVLDDPPPDVLVVGVGEATVDLRARWWAKSRVPDALLVQDLVLAGIKTGLQSAGIDTAASQRSTVTTVAVSATEAEGTSSDAETEAART